MNLAMGCGVRVMGGREGEEGGRFGGRGGTVALFLSFTHVHVHYTLFSQHLDAFVLYKYCMR